MTEYLTALYQDMTPERVAAIGGVVAGGLVALATFYRAACWAWTAACWLCSGRKPDANLAALLETIETGTGATVQGGGVLAIGPLKVYTEATRTAALPSGVIVHVNGADRTDLYAPHELRAIRRAAVKRIAAYLAAEREAGRALAAEVLAAKRGKA